LGITACAPDAHSLFGKDHHKRINQAAHKHQQLAGEDHHSHPKFWNQVLSEQWRQVMSTVRADYEQQAKMHKDTMQGTPDQAQIYRFV
jgi:hypothetical protein